MPSPKPDSTQPKPAKIAPDSAATANMTNSTTAHDVEHNANPHDLSKGEQKDGYGHPVKDQKPPEGDKGRGKDKYGYHTLSKNSTDSLAPQSSLSKTNKQPAQNVAKANNVTNVAKPAEAKKPAPPMPMKEPNRPAILIVGAHHARELITLQMTLYQILKLIHAGLITQQPKYRNLLA